MTSAYSPWRRLAARAGGDEETEHRRLRGLGDVRRRSPCPPRAGGPGELLELTAGAIALTERLRERLGGLHRALDRRVVVSERDEPRLELRRRRVDAALQQGAAEAPVGLEVAGGGPGEVA